MKRRSLHLRRLILVLLGMLTVAVIGCGTRLAEKIPITTSSELAREYFHKAEELAGCYHLGEAREYYLKAIKEDPDFAVAYCCLAFVTPNTEEVFERLETADGLSRPQNGNPPRQSKLGLSLSGILSEDASANMINEASKRVNHVSKGERLWILGYNAMLAHDQSKFYDCMSKLVEMYPKDGRAHCMLGDYYWRNGDHRSAAEQFRIATELNPSDIWAFNMLGYNYALVDSYDLAKQAFKQCIALRPDEPNPYDSYAELLLRTGQHDESITNYQHALSLDSTFINARSGIAANLNYLNRHEEARDYLDWPPDSSLTIEARRMLQLSKAVSFLDQGNTPAAVEALEQRCRLANQSGTLYESALDHDAIGRILVEQGELAAAETNFRMAKEIVEQSSLPPNVIERYKRFFRMRMNCYVAPLRGDITDTDTFISELKKTPGAADDADLQRALNLCEAIRALAAEDFDTAIALFEQDKRGDPSIAYWLGHAYEQVGRIEDARQAYESITRQRLLNSIGLAMMRPRAQAALERLTAS